ncbi:MAG: hypothetical protein EBX50_06840 [Chitinophagia bacterium]|nr:hypothetical protein [Chitinophagia bacterium]
MRLASILQIGLLAGILWGCVEKKQVDDVPAQLKKTMKQFLEQSANGNTTGTEFTVENVAYYADKEFYECEFTVRMKRLTGKDTTGQMLARIKKDYSSVMRKY